MEIEHGSVDCMISLKGKCQESAGSGDGTTRLVRTVAMAYHTIPKVGTRPVSKNHTLPVKVQADSSKESDILDFITGWGDEERQMPMKEEIKTPE